MSNRFASGLRLARHGVLALTGLLAAASGFAATNVGVSVSINQPGFYGRVDIGDQPAPAVIYPQPVIIDRGPVAVYQRPIYMRVPPGHYKNWGRYCHNYNACGQPVYFINPDRNGPAPRMDRRDDRRDDRWDDRRDDRHDRGNGHGNGRGHDRHDH